MQYPRSEEQYENPVPQWPHIEQHLEESRHTPVPTAPSPQYALASGLVAGEGGGGEGATASWRQGPPTQVLPQKAAPAGDRYPTEKVEQGRQSGEQASGQTQA